MLYCTWRPSALTTRPRKQVCTDCHHWNNSRNFWKLIYLKSHLRNRTVCDCKGLLKRLVLPTVLYKLSTLHYMTLHSPRCSHRLAEFFLYALTQSCGTRQDHLSYASAYVTVSNRKQFYLLSLSATKAIINSVRYVYAKGGSVEHSVCESWASWFVPYEWKHFKETLQFISGW